jgi:DNA-directed RNA polymerase subunit E'/Rpb7
VGGARRNAEIFTRSIISTKVVIPFHLVGKNYVEILRAKIAEKVEGRCIADGYIRGKSVEIVQHSAGKLHMENVEFQVVYACDVCLPVEGMILECKSKTITQKAGIHAECVVDGVAVITVFVSKEDNATHPKFRDITEPDMTLTVKVVGVIFELNDQTITVIADLV